MPIILLADDEAPLRTLLSRSLQRNGYEVYAASDGLQAFRMGLERIATLDLLVADICMPGLEGTELAKRLREVRPNLRVLFISGYSKEQDLSDPLLQKPFEVATLLKKVKELITAERKSHKCESQTLGK